MRRTYTPRAYAQLAIDHLNSSDRVALWAGMGTGKTVLTLTWLDALHNVMGEDAPTLVLGPKRVARDGWAKEANKWNHLSGLEVISGVGDVDHRVRALKQLAKGNAQILAVNYDVVPWMIDWFKDQGKAWPFKTVIPDESTKLKGFRLKQGTVRAQALAEIAHTEVKRWVNLTGAPAPNGLKDLWGQTWFLDAGQRLGRTYDAFESRWFGYRRVRDAINKREHIQTVIFPHSQDEIMERLSDICLTIRAKDWFDLREPIVTEVPVELEPSARAKYKSLEKELFMALESGEIVEVFSSAGKSNKCLQLANGAVYLDPERYGKGTWVEVSYAKLEALESVVEEACGTPVLVAYKFESDRERILRHFKGQAVDISVPAGFDQFMSGSVPIGVVHPQSMGHGIDGLQDVTNILCFFGMDWDLDTHDQMVERIGPTRQQQSGHDREVRLYYLVAQNTIDEAARERLKTKRDTQDVLIDYMTRRKNDD